MHRAKRISELFQLNDENWLKHANPRSVWTRFFILPLLVVAAWSRIRIGRRSLLPIILLGWRIRYNPRAFSHPKTTRHRSSQAVLGEKVWVNRERIAIPDHHASIITLLTWVSLIGAFLVVIGVVFLHVPTTLVGLVLTLGGKLWFLDRMVRVRHDMKDHPAYADFDF